MPRLDAGRRAALLFWAPTLLFASLLAFKGLGASPLWQDEAETALLARNTLSFGLPKTTDGRNLVSQNRGEDHDSRFVWNYSPWLAIYLAAASLGLFGESPFAARLPFALCGIASLLLLHRLARRWSGEERVARLAVWLTLLSVAFLLYWRQCRYYPLAVLFTLYLLDAYHRLLDESPRAGLHLFVAAQGLFHSNFLVFFGVLGGLAAHFSLLVPDKAARLRRHRVPLAATAAALAPWLLYFGAWGKAAGPDPRPLLRRLANLRDVLWDLDARVLPAFAAVLVPFARRRVKGLDAPLLFMAGTAAALAAAPHYFFRYLLCLVPLGAFVSASILASLWRLHPVLGAASLGLLLSTNLPGVSCWAGRAPVLRTDLADFARELLEPPKQPLDAAVAYLNAHAAPSDLALVTYPDLPFMFHTRLRVVGGGSGDHEIRLQDVRWVVLRDESEQAFWPVDYEDFERIPLEGPGAPWGNRPDPVAHVFRTVTASAQPVLYHRVR